MSENVFQNYALDLGFLLKEKARLAKKKENESKGAVNHAYDLGFLMAMHEVVSIMQQQAELFSIDISMVGLEGVDPERELI